MDIYDEQLGEQASIEKDIQQLTLTEISSQRTGLSSRIGHLSNEISDLAFNNYRTYADAGRTAEHCKKMFSNIHSNVTSIKENMPELTSGIKTFAEKTKEFHKEYDNVATVNNRDNLLWKILDMPKIMHQCIRSGEYEAAFALTDFAVSLKHSRLYQQPIIKKPVDFVIEARHGLLDELFNKFSGPIDLSRSIQVVNNIRKIPYISNTQLRVSILQYRDVFLDSQVTKSMSKEDYIYKIVDIYRDCMYDTMVLYLAVFPDTESHRRFVTTHDPRWERWTGSSQNYHLQAWAHKNLEHLFEYIRNCTASKINYEALREKLMSFASSFGRMGLDFRLLILEELRSVETKIFKEKVAIALHNLISKKVIHLVDSEIVEMARSGLIQNNAMEAASLPLDMIAWDDLVAYANEIITCLNDLRHSLGVNQINDLFETLVNSFTQLLSWIDGFLESEEDSVLAKRASRIVIEHFIPFMQTHFKSSFSLPLQEKWRLRDETDSVTPFDFKLDCAAYEPTPQKEYKSDNAVNGETSHINTEPVKDFNGQNISPEANTESSHFGAFASTFASQMQALWHDDVNPQSESEAKMDEKKNLNERFEKAFSARSSQEPQNVVQNITEFTQDGVKKENELTAAQISVTSEENYVQQNTENFNKNQETPLVSTTTLSAVPAVPVPVLNADTPFSTINLDESVETNDGVEHENEEESGLFKKAD